MITDLVYISFLAGALLILKEAPEMSTVGTAHPLCTERWRGRGGEEQPTLLRDDGNGIFCVYLYSCLWSAVHNIMLY